MSPVNAHPNRHPHPTASILYVKSPAESAAFYQALLGQPPVEASPGFAMFILGNGTMLGLWAAHDVQPAATAPGGSELCIQLGADDDVTALHQQWQARGVPVAQAPTHMDFGYTFVAIDPDGHRLRVFAPGAEP